MSLVIKGSSSGQVTIDVPAAAGTNTITLPASTFTVPTSSGSLVLLDSSTLSSAASTIEISASTIGTTYNHLKLYAVAIPKSSSAFFLRMRDSSASVLSSVSDYGEQIYRGGGTDFNDSSVSALTL